VRRLLLVLLCVTGLGFVLIVLLWSPRRRNAAAPTGPEGGRSGDGVRVARPDVETDESGSAGSIDQDDASIAREMARIRASSFVRASHSLLFSMAQDRGVASGRSSSTRKELLDAILTAEGVNADQPESTLALQRLRTLADKVGRQESDAIAEIVLRARRFNRQRSKA
jgi:hypothetical protein